MKALEPKEKKLLLDLLSLDLERIGFDEKEIKILNNVYTKVKDEKIKTKAKKAVKKAKVTPVKIAITKL